MNNRRWPRCDRCGTTIDWRFVNSGDGQGPVLRWFHRNRGHDQNHQVRREVAP